MNLERLIGLETKEVLHKGRVMEVHQRHKEPTEKTPIGARATLKDLHDATKILCATTKTWYSQIIKNKYFLKLFLELLKVWYYIGEAHINQTSVPMVTPPCVCNTS